MAVSVKIPLLGYSVDADWYEGSSDEVLLVLTGFKSNKDKYSDMAGVINNQTGQGVLVVEYSGHGASPINLDDIRPAEHFLEAISAYDWLVQNNPDKRINVTGASYGGFLATQLTKYRAFDKLLLRVPAIYQPDNFYTKWRHYDYDLGYKYRHEESGLENHPLLKRASDFTGKTLVITHELDDVCPPNSTDAFVKAFGAEHWVEPGIKHGFSESDLSEERKQEYYQKMAEWLAK